MSLNCKSVATLTIRDDCTITNFVKPALDC